MNENRAGRGGSEGGAGNACLPSARPVELSSTGDALGQRGTAGERSPGLNGPGATQKEEAAWGKLSFRNTQAMEQNRLLSSESRQALERFQF